MKLITSLMQVIVTPLQAPYSLILHVQLVLKRRKGSTQLLHLGLKTVSGGVALLEKFLPGLAYNKFLGTHH